MVGRTGRPPCRADRASRHPRRDGGVVRRRRPDRVDHGSHRLHHAIEPHVLAELAALLGDDLQRRDRHGRLRFDGRWLDFPLRAGDLVRGLPPRTTAAMGRDAVLAPLRRPHGDSFSAIVTAGLGPTVADRFYLPYARKLFGVAPEELDGELARRRVSGRSVTAIARRLASRRGSTARTFLYPRHGFGQITEALATAAKGAGVSIRLGTDVAAVAIDDDGATLRLADGTELPRRAALVDHPHQRPGSPDVAGAAG